MQLSDQELICQIQQRDGTAFDTFFARYRTAILRHVNQIVHDNAAADDVTQETFLRVWTRAEQWDGSGAVKGWLYRIATNLALNHLRTLRRRPQRSLRLQPNEVSTDDYYGSTEEMVPSWLIDTASLRPHEAAERAEQQQQLWQVVDKLPEDKRAVFRLVYDAQMDLHSVAETLGVPTGTVKSRLYYGKKQLAQKLSEL